MMKLNCLYICSSILLSNSRAKRLLDELHHGVLEEVEDAHEERMVAPKKY